MFGTHSFFIFSLDAAQREGTRRDDCLRAATLRMMKPRSRSAGVEVGQRMVVVEDRSGAIGDRDQLHRAAALDTTHGWFGQWLGNRLLGQHDAPSPIKPDQHADPRDRELAVGAGKAIVPQLLKVSWQRVLQEAAHELVSRNGS